MSAITLAKLQRWHELDKQRLELQRAAAQYEKDRDLLSIELKEELERSQKDAVIRGQFRCFLKDGTPYVSWKDEFVKAKGAEAAAELVKAAPIRRKVYVEELTAKKAA